MPLQRIDGQLAKKPPHETQLSHLKYTGMKGHTVFSSSLSGLVILKYYGFSSIGWHIDSTM